MTITKNKDGSVTIEIVNTQTITILPDEVELYVQWKNEELESLKAQVEWIDSKYDDLKKSELEYLKNSISSLEHEIKQFTS